MAPPKLRHLNTAQQRERAESLLVTAYRSGITDPKELANFMGQVQHESQNFTKLEENLNYSGTRLYEVFGKRNGLTPERAEVLASIKNRTERLQAVGEHVYGGGWGKSELGNTQVGDGYKYRGRGYMQLTGRDNYTTYGKSTGIDLVNHPELAATEAHAERLAVRYWKDRVQPTTSARSNVTQAGSIINTGEVGGKVKGLADRQANAAAWQRALDGGYLQEALARHPLPEEAALQLKPTHELSPASLRLLRDSEHHVRALADRHQLPWDAGMDNTVHALAAQAREQGLTGITHLKVAGGQIRFAQHAQGEPLRESQIDAKAAANTGVDLSVGRMVQADQPTERDVLAAATPEPARTQEPALAL